ncbi:electron transport complex protein RnfA [Limnochorda pilosa]|uniref:Ion-translocating oxidoreductase complex subunit A n=1 Tax=Limnochorda pilosa TaxID=1555112 RepID=A0A0K2SQ42_LIMPI|nr:RnfABCDGE type electron transport complex subunit A [Limnochorda pilosa]BAS29243.1 electron transport complex RsxE subunit [Limnochorda pilosa]
MSELLLLFVGAALVNNFLLSRFLGICPFLGVTREVKAAASMGAAVTFVMLVTGVVVWLLQTYVLGPLGLAYLQYVAFILVIAVLVQLLEMVIRKMSPALYEAFGIYLPLITTNCAILGLALLVVINGYSLAQTLVFAIGSAAGFTLAMVMMASIREEMEFADVPPALQGTALSLLIAGLMSLAFLGFSGLAAA